MDLPPDLNNDDDVDDELPASPPPRPASRPAPARPRAARPSRPAARPAPRRAPEPEPEEEEEDWRPKRPEPAPAPAATVRQERDAAFTTPDEAIHEARAFVESLSLPDKLTVGGFGLLAVSLFLPWRETAANGDELGIITSGFLAALFGLGALGALLVRLREPFPNLPPHVPPLAQVAMAGLGILFCVVFLVTSYDGTPVLANVGSGTMRASTPSLGAIIGLAGAGVGLLGSVLGLKEKQS